MSELSLSLLHEEMSTRLVCAGDVTSASAPNLNHAFIIAVGAGPAELHLDMTRVGMFSFEGVIALLRAARWCAESDIVFRLESGPAVSEALRLAGLSWLGVPEEGREIDEVNELVLRARAFRRLIETPSVM